ncbi:MAG: hypothetical protein ACYSUI_19860 [Planctomycetota bacterium]|jgi:hypothetical protein
MLHPKIDEISTATATGGTFVLARFWKTRAARTRGDKPFLTNSFVLDTTGVVPEEEIRKQVHAYAERAETLGYAGDHSAASATAGDAFFEGGKEIRRAGAGVLEPTQRDESDPHGVLARPEVQDLIGKDIDLGVA